MRDSREYGVDESDEKGNNHMQALIITAYKNKALLEKNIQLFSKYFKCFVHIDKKSDLNNADYIRRLNSIENTVVISKYKINWGSYLHMMAILDLLNWWFVIRISQECILLAERTFH